MMNTAPSSSTTTTTQCGTATITTTSTTSTKRMRRSYPCNDLGALHHQCQQEQEEQGEEGKVEDDDVSSTVLFAHGWDHYKVPTTASGGAGAADRIDNTYTCVEEGVAQSWRKKRSYRTARCHSSSIVFHCINQYQHQSRTSGAFYQRISSALYTLHEQE